MRSARVRSYARRRHSTGLLDQAEVGNQLLAEFRSHIPFDLAGSSILEIGPGQGMELMRATVALGVSYSAFDIEDYLERRPMTEYGVDYRVDPDGRLSWPAGSFDVVWSYSVLEHVREPGVLLRQVASLMKPGGVFVSLIDMETHSGRRNEAAEMYEFLRFPPWLWHAMTSHRSTYVNRLRMSDWRKVFADSGLAIVAEVPNTARCGLDELRAVPYLRNLNDEDLLTRRALFIARPTT